MNLRTCITGLACITTACFLGAGSAAASTLLYASDFEAPVFNTGPLGDAYGLPLSGQDGWRALPREPYATAPSPWVAVTNERAYSGSQSVQLRMDASFYNGVNGVGASMYREYAPTPLVLNSPSDVFSVSVRLYLEQAPTSQLGWALNFSNSIGSLGVRINPDNSLWYAHRLMNQPAVFNPGFDLHNSWLQLSLERDPTDWTLLVLTVSNGSASFQTRVGGFGEPMTAVGIAGVLPNVGTPYGIAYVDDFRMGYNLAAVPEPASAALLLLGLGGLLAAARRRG